MDIGDPLDSDEYIELLLPGMPIRQEDLSPMSGSVLIQPNCTTGFETQMSTRMATARRKDYWNSVRANPQAEFATMPNLDPMTCSVEDVWKADSGWY
jgi:hypothetical protein